MSLLNYMKIYFKYFLEDYCLYLGTYLIGFPYIELIIKGLNIQHL
jgi:hypothetical protein